MVDTVRIKAPTGAPPPPVPMPDMAMAGTPESLNAVIGEAAEPTSPAEAANAQPGTDLATAEPQPEAVPQDERQVGETQRLRETITSDRSRQYLILAEVDKQIDDAGVRKTQMAAAIAACEKTLADARTAATNITLELDALHTEREQVTARITKYSLMLVDGEVAEMKRPRV